MEKRFEITKKLELPCVKCGEMCLAPLACAARPICKSCHYKGKAEVGEVISDMRKRKNKPKEDALLERQVKMLSRLINTME